MHTVYRHPLWPESSSPIGSKICKTNQIITICSKLRWCDVLHIPFRQCLGLGVFKGIHETSYYKQCLVNFEQMWWLQDGDCGRAAGYGRWQSPTGYSIVASMLDLCLKTRGTGCFDLNQSQHSTFLVQANSNWLLLVSWYQTVTQILQFQSSLHGAKPISGDQVPGPVVLL